MHADRECKACDMESYLSRISKHIEMDHRQHISTEIALLYEAIMLSESGLVYHIARSICANRSSPVAHHTSKSVVAPLIHRSP